MTCKQSDNTIKLLPIQKDEISISYIFACKGNRY